MPASDTTAARLRAAREAAGLTQGEAARAAGVHKVSVSRWEGGRKIGAADLARLARAYGVEPGSLIAGGSRSVSRGTPDSPASPGAESPAVQAEVAWAQSTLAEFAAIYASRIIRAHSASLADALAAPGAGEAWLETMRQEGEKNRAEIARKKAAEQGTETDGGRKTPGKGTRRPA